MSQQTKLLTLTFREARPGGPWGFKTKVCLTLRGDTLVWNTKSKLLETREGYEPAGARLYYLGVPMANCRTLADYHVANLGTIHIMKGAQGCVEAGKSCICATHLQHVLNKNKREVAERRAREEADQKAKLRVLVSASTRQESLNRILFLQVESALLLISSRSVHNTEAAQAAVRIAETMVKSGAQHDIACNGSDETAKELMKRLVSIFYPRFRKWPPLLQKLAKILSVKVPRPREDEQDIDSDVITDDATGMDVVPLKDLDPTVITSESGFDDNDINIEQMNGEFVKKKGPASDISRN